MEVSRSHEFSAPFDDVWAMLQAAEAHVAKYEHMGHRDVEVIEHTGDDDQFRIVVRRQVEIDLPGFAKKVMSPSNTVTTTDEWRRTAADTAEGTQTVDTSGAPIKVAATTRLRRTGDATTYDVDITVDVKVPLIGGKLGKWAGGMVAAQLEQDFAAGDAWLAGR